MHNATATTVAIEFGGSEFRTLRREHGRLLARRVSTDYLVVPGNDERKRLLERQAEEFAHCDDGLVLFGPSAIDLSDLLGLPMQSALDNGKLRTGDPVSRQFLGAIVEGLLPVSESAEICPIVAAQPSRSDHDSSSEFLTQLVKLRGYTPYPISPGLGMTVAECANEAFSAIAIKMGADGVDVSIVHQTRELLQFHLPRGGNDIDRQLANHFNSYYCLRDGREVLDVRAVRNWRLAVVNLNQVANERVLELRNQYRELVFLTLHRLRQELTSELLAQLPARLPLVIGGALAAPAGVDRLFSNAIAQIEMPIDVSHVRRAQDTTFAALRGGLIAGQTLAARNSVPAMPSDAIAA